MKQKDKKIINYLMDTLCQRDQVREIALVALIDLGSAAAAAGLAYGVRQLARAVTGDVYAAGRLVGPDGRLLGTLERLKAAGKVTSPLGVAIATLLFAVDAIDVGRVVPAGRLNMVFARGGVLLSVTLADAIALASASKAAGADQCFNQAAEVVVQILGAYSSSYEDELDALSKMAFSISSPLILNPAAPLIIAEARRWAYPESMFGSASIWSRLLTGVTLGAFNKYPNAVLKMTALAVSSSLIAFPVKSGLSFVDSSNGSLLDCVDWTRIRDFLRLASRGCHLLEQLLDKAADAITPEQWSALAQDDGIAQLAQAWEPTSNSEMGDLFYA